MSPTRSELARGTALGRYVVLALEGAGRMGVVYAAYDPRLDRKIALKLLRADEGAPPTDEDRQRLLREARAMARLSHAHVVQVYDVGEVEGDVYIAMEHVEGRTLRQWLAERPRSVDEIVHAFSEAGRGLAAAHAAGIVHRDFKPENVLVDGQGRVRVTDFGLARPPGRAGVEVAPRPGPLAALGTLTATGALLGTPAYAAPEQFTGDPTDHRTDQFSFCVALYEALYGERPFQAGTEAELVFAVTMGRFRPPPRDARVPGWLRAAVLTGLSPSPAHRHASMERLLAACARSPARRVGRGLAWALAAAAVAGVAAGAVLGRQVDPCRGGPRRLAGIWDAERRDEVRRALLGSHRPFSEAAARGAVDALDAYAAGWTAMYGEACESTQVRREQTESVMDLRMRCLSRRLGELSAVVELLSGPDAPAERAVEAARGLRDVRVCADVEALRAVVEPADERQRDAVAAAHHELDRAKALLASGRYAQALARARPVASQAQGLGYPPLLAEALLVQGNAEVEAYDPAAAEETLYRAVRAAEVARDDELRGRVLAALVRVHGLWQGRFREAYREADQAGGVAERLGAGHEELRADIDTQLGFALRDDGRHADALERFRAALALRERTLPPDHPDVVRTHNAIALTLADLGRLEEAVAEERRVIPALEAALGPDHPNVASVYDNLGGQLFSLGRYREGLPLLERALRIRLAALGDQDLEVAFSLCNLAECRARLGEGRTMVSQAEEALRRVQRAEGRTLYWAQVSIALGDVRRVAGDLRGARADLLAAADAARKAGGADHPVVAAAVALAGECDLGAGESSSALARFREAQRIDEKRLRPDHPDLSRDLGGLGRSLLALGRSGEAIAPLERARRLAAGRSPGDQGEIAFALARARWESGGSRDQALADARAARDALERGQGLDRRLLPEVEAWLRRREARPGRAPTAAP